MFKPNRSFFVFVIVLASSTLLFGCGGNDNGTSGPTQVVSQAASGTVTNNMAKPIPTSTSSVVLATYESESAFAAITTCNIEAFDQTSFQSTAVDAEATVQHKISGWIAAPQIAAPSFWLRLDDKTHGRHLQAPLKLMVKRPDVAAAKNLPSFLNSGFTLELPANAVPVGQYHVYLVAEADGETRVCDDGRQVHFK